MTVNIKVQKISSAETPREVIAADRKPPGNKLPIRGGWGYSREDAVIIDKDDPIVPKVIPFDGIGIEYIFVEQRIYEELIIFQPKGSKHRGIEWNLLKQKLTFHEDRTYDVLTFEVTALLEDDWEALKAEWEKNNGFLESESGLKIHEKKRNERTIRYTTEYWFDITSFSKI
jgi:hypothetical protein